MMNTELLSKRSDVMLNRRAAPLSVQEGAQQRTMWLRVRNLGSGVPCLPWSRVQNQWFGCAGA
jgi:hypothetical protein